MEDEPINAMDLLGKYCFAEAAVKIESIFIGNKISLQVKLYECNVEPTQTGMKRLLARPKANTRVLKQEAQDCSRPPMDMDDDKDDDTGSLVGSGDDVGEEPAQVKKKTVKKMVKRVVKKVVRKSAGD
jgi:hypothetical protein